MLFGIILKTEICGKGLTDIKLVGYSHNETRARQYCDANNSNINKHNNIIQYYTYNSMECVDDKDDNIEDRYIEESTNNLKSQDLDDIFNDDSFWK